MANEEVNILDPAAGTGTFLMSAIQQVHERIKKKNGALGEDIVKKKFTDKVLKHILKHFYGFELLVAPYAIAHLKLALEIERLGFDFNKTYEDEDPTNDRFQVFLANSLDNPENPKIDLFGFESISKESESARDIKNNKEVLAIIGNPPYSNFGMMNKQPWILDLLKDYKKNLNEKKINIDDDYIKFIRFAQWKLHKSGQGIFAMITSNSFIDGITHRRMRGELLNEFNEIYILNLHGNSRKGEVCTDGSTDENVFNIQTGVSINFFIKKNDNNEPCNLCYFDLWGLKKYKYEWLDNRFNKLNWIEIDYKNFNSAFLSTKWSEFLGKLNFFVPNADDSSDKIVEYGDFWGVQDIFHEYGSGVKTERDGICIHFDKKELTNTLNDFRELTEDELKKKYNLEKDSRDWKIDNAKNDTLEHRDDDNLIFDISYRPFDIRKIWYSGKTRGFVGTPGYKTMRNLLKLNFALVTTRLIPGDSFHHSFLVKSLADIHIISDQNYIFPIYIYPEIENIQSNILNEKEFKSNLNNKFISEFSKRLYMKYIGNGPGDLSKTFGSEDIFYYIYAILHCPTYRNRYAEQLKIDFPRIPLIKDKKLFKNLVKKGKELVNLHLLGENPFDDSSTIFDDNSKWNVITGGKKPENIEDWKIEKVEYEPTEKRVYVNSGQYFEGIELEVWEFMIGGYQVLEKWLKDRKKADRCLSVDDLVHYMKIVVSLRETIRVMKEIDELIPKWPIE